MAQLIATNQLTLTNVIDGKTPYVHWAYSDNADGTGITLTDNGQRYIGNYSDYTQADSTDKTKYRWADRWARLKLEDNLLLNSSFNQNLDKWQGFGTAIVDGKAKIIGEFNKSKYIYQSIKSQIANDDVDQVYIASISVKVTNYVPGSVNPYLALYIEGRKNDSTNTWFGVTYLTTNSLVAVNNKGVVQFTTTFKVNVVRSQIGDISFNIFTRDFTGEVEFEKSSLRRGDIDLGWQASPTDVQNQLNTKADQAKVVYKTDISVTDEGIVHSASKTVNGQTIASMIAQRAEWVEIIAKLLKVKGDMIVDGTIGANKLSVSTLSALAADLGQISGGSLELLKSEAQGTSSDSWGSFTIPAHKWGLYIDNIGAISSGTPVRKSSSESVASDMPVAVLTSGQLRFARVNQNNDLGSVLNYGLSDPDNATISFVVAQDGTKQLLIQANGQIVNQGTNYTGWTSTGVSGVYYKRQGDVVALKMQIATTANQTYSLGKIPVALLPIPNNGTMMRVTSWTADHSIGRNLQFNSDGSMALLASSRGDTFNTQVTWII